MTKMLHSERLMTQASLSWDLETKGIKYDQAGILQGRSLEVLVRLAGFLGPAAHMRKA